MSTNTLTLSPLSGFQRHLRLTLCSIGEPTFLFGAYPHVKSEQSGTQPSKNVWFVSRVSRDTFKKPRRRMSHRSNWLTPLRAAFHEPHMVPNDTMCGRDTAILNQAPPTKNQISATPRGPVV